MTQQYGYGYGYQAYGYAQPTVPQQPTAYVGYSTPSRVGYAPNATQTPVPSQTQPVQTAGTAQQYNVGYSPYSSTGTVATNQSNGEH